jgi:putative transposase
MKIVLVLVPCFGSEQARPTERAQSQSTGSSTRAQEHRTSIGPGQKTQKHSVSDRSEFRAEHVFLLRFYELLCYIASVMRFPRVKAQGRSFYHCISRFVHGLYIFGTSGGRCAEAEEFLSLMRRWAALTGIRIRKYVLMANHFHLLCEVPEPKPLTQNEMLERIEAGYGSERAQTLREQLAHFAQQPDGLEQSERLLDPYRQQMKSDHSFFMKQLKGCFAQQYNRRHKRHGTLWSERFKSVLLEGGPAVAAIAAYIDLNPVRAGLCEDPKD